MYSIITTEGFVIDSRPSGEAGKLLYIFTRDHGLVMAVAQGIRLEKSKLRYFTQNYSFGIFSFVKGKEYWRLTNAQELVNSAESIVYIGNKNKLDDMYTELLARIAMLLKKLLNGEEANENLFGVVSSLYSLKYSENFDHIDFSSLESLIVLRIFHRLGYIGDIGSMNILLSTNDINLEIFDTVKINRIYINKHINKAIKESHL